MPALPVAEELTLRRLRPGAPPFHRHIARSRLIGSAWKVGDRVVVYEIVDAVPAGTVEVTASTRLVFE